MNGVSQGRQLIVARQLVRQPVRQALRPKHRQALLTQLPQALLGEAFGRGIDRCQRLLDSNRLIAGDGTVFRVVDLKARGAGTGFTVAAYVCAALEAVPLRVAEVVKAQAQHPGAVADPDQQTAALAHDHVGAADHAFDHGVLTRAQLTDGHDASPVLITQGQVKQHVLNVLKTDFRQLFSHGLTDAF